MLMVFLPFLSWWNHCDLLIIIRVNRKNWPHNKIPILFRHLIEKPFDSMKIRRKTVFSSIPCFAKTFVFATQIRRMCELIIGKSVKWQKSVQITSVFGLGHVFRKVFESQPFWRPQLMNGRIESIHVEQCSYFPKMMKCFGLKMNVRRNRNQALNF